MLGYIFYISCSYFLIPKKKGYNKNSQETKKNIHLTLGKEKYQSSQMSIKQNLEQPPILCLTITYMHTGRDVRKAFANANNAAMYHTLKNQVISHLAISPNDANGLDTWLAAGNDLYFHETETNEHGSPKIRSLFQQVETKCPPEVFFVGYANADILFDSSLIKTLEKIKSLLVNVNASLNEILIVGRRSNHELFNNRLKSSEIKNVPSNLFQDDAQDYFITTRNFFDWNSIPDYVIGRRAYDNALVDWAYHHKTLLDATETILALHQTVADGNSAGHFPRPDKEYNVQLKGAAYDHAFINLASYKTMFSHTKDVIVFNKNTNMAVE